MASVLTEVIIDCRDPRRVAQFWRDVLAWPMVEDARGYYWLSATGEPTAPPLLVFVPVPEPKTVKNRLHIDITTGGSLEDGVARLVAMGGRLVEMRQDPETLANPDTWAVMQDPEGNEFCVFNVDSVTGLA